MSINYEAVSTLSMRLRKARQYAPMVVDAWMSRIVGPDLVKTMQEKAPVDSGRLRASIRLISTPGRIRVGPFGVEYNRYVVEGTKPHTITGKNGKMLAFQINGKMVYRRSVKHPGTRANPYMKQAADEVMARSIPKLAQLQLDVIKTGQVSGQ